MSMLADQMREEMREDQAARLNVRSWIVWLAAVAERWSAIKEGSIRGKHRTNGQGSYPYRPHLRGPFALLVLGFLALLLPATAMAWTDAAFNFRDTSGYVTVVAPETYVQGYADSDAAISCPRNRGGFDFCWSGITFDSRRDRDSAVDRRLAGGNQQPNSGAQATFNVTMTTSGTKRICVAAGDATISQGYTYFQIKDNTTVLATVDGSSGFTAPGWYDASGVLRNATTWPSSQACVDLVFATTSFNIVIGTPTAQSGSTAISHLRITDVVTTPDYWCGVDTNFDGTVSNPCPTVAGVTDADHDGWSTANKVGPFGTGKDCDDTNFWIQPGFEDTTGCSAGNYRTCNTDGTWTACAAISGFTCNTANGATYFVDDAETDCSGAGTYADPEDWRCWFSTGMVGYHAPGDGDCIVFQPGTYSSTWSDGGTIRQLYINQKDGSETHPIKFRSLPGAIPGYVGEVKIQGAGTAPTPVFPWFITLSDSVKTIGLHIDGTGGYSGAGIVYDGSANPEAWLNVIEGIDGIEDNNVSCIKFQVGTTAGYAHHNIVYDCYERADVPAINNVAIRTMDDIGYVKYLYNIIPNSVLVSGCLDIKHANDDCSLLAQGNFGRNCAYFGETENKDSVFKNNWVQDCGDSIAFKQASIGTTGPPPTADGPWHKDAVFSYNTIERCAFLNSNPEWDSALGHPNFSGTTIFTAERNIVVDDNASYDGDAGDGMARFCDSQCEDGEFAAAVGKAIWRNNVYYNPNDTNLNFSYFGTVGGGAYYSTLALFQAAGFDIGTVQANPSLDADGISAAYPNHGWAAGSVFSDVAPASTGTNNTGGFLLRLLRSRR